MILKQYYLGCLAHASYLVGDEHAGVAAVVDPQRDVQHYLDDAKELGVAIRYVLLTHFHADFLAGHLELRDRCGAEIGLGARATAEYRFRPLAEGDAIDLGRVQLRILETPGHTPEAISFVVYDRSKEPERPHAVLTGDTLFIGDVGRPDLFGAAGLSSTDLAGALYDSLHKKLLALPDETLVYPAHGAGSMCGKNLSSETVSTLGVQRRNNHALRPMSKPQFVALVTADQPEAPAYFAYDAKLNQKERPTLEAALAKALKPMSLDQVLRLADQGAQLLDVREPGDFLAAHLAGAVNVGLAGKFATWCGTVLDRDRPVVLIADPGREEEAAMRLGRIGFDHVAGYLEGGMSALADRPELVRADERLTALELREALKVPNPPVVLDVRSEAEFRQNRVPGAVNLPLPQLRRRIKEVPQGELVVHCQGDYRSTIAVSLLAGAGRQGMRQLVGGIGAWERVSAES